MENNKKAVIVGATSGIGYAVALELINKGWILGIAGRRVDKLKELTVEEYSETKIDKDDLDPPLLWVFGKNIHRQLVYIKLKIKENQSRHVLCVSFHYAKEKMKFPYA